MLRGLPLSRDSISANSSRCCSSRSASFQIMRPRSEGDMRGQGPSSKARRAARTARLTSSSSASGTSVTTSPVAGLKTGKYLPEAAVTKRPSMYIWWRWETKSAVVPLMRGSIAMVAIAKPRVQQVAGRRWGDGTSLRKRAGVSCGVSFCQSRDAPEFAPENTTTGSCALARGGRPAALRVDIVVL